MTNIPDDADMTATPVTPRPLPVNILELLAVLKLVDLHDFDKSDWSAWGGCESPNPKIGYLDNLVVIVDDNDIQVTYADDDSWVTFRLESASGQLNWHAVRRYD